MIPPRTTGSVFVCLVVFASPNALAVDSPPNPPIVPPRLSLRTETHWGYGCGGHCAFSHSGESKVAVEFGEDGVVRVADTGSGEAQMNSPDGVSFTTRKWELSWTGNWKEVEGKRMLSLKPGAGRCDETTSNGEKRERRPCVTGRVALELACSAENVTARTGVSRPAKSGGQEVLAVVCRPPGGAEKTGTDFPWVFGIGKPLKTMKTGEPQPEVFFLISDRAF